jgi:hypothetical protein
MIDVIERALIKAVLRLIADEPRGPPQQANAAWGDVESMEVKGASAACAVNLGGHFRF